MFLRIKILIFFIFSTHIFSVKACVVSDSCNAFPDYFYEYQLALIDQKTTIPFDFTPQVRRYLQIYIDTRRQQVAEMLALSQLYFPMMDSIFAAHELPRELKYLSAVESALDPCAVSVSNAVGLWQFKEGSAVLYGLKIGPELDERRDPEKSTAAACAYLADLYRQFKSWHLALAAYNIGPTALQAIIKQSKGSTNFWKLYPNLPEAAQNFVPAFIAVTYIMNNNLQHGITANKPIITYSQTDTIRVGAAIDFETFAAKTGIPLVTIEFLNPQYVLKTVPKGAILRIPADKKNVAKQNG